jgi:hypothetical protein
MGATLCVPSAAGAACPRPGIAAAAAKATKTPKDRHRTFMISSTVGVHQVPRNYATFSFLPATLAVHKF